MISRCTFGFRVADRPDDDGPNLGESGTKSLDQEAILERALSAFDLELPDLAAIEREAEVHLADATIPEHLEWINDEA